MCELVTIAMPVYNVSKYVERSILSALNQTYPNIEVLVVDDKGTDNSIELVKRILKQHPRGNCVRIIDHVINRGTGATKNSAIDSALGAYLFFMDSDDMIDDDAISQLYRIMKEGDYEVVCGSHVNYDADNNVKKVFRFFPYKGKKSLSKFVYEDTMAWPIYTWNKLYAIDFLRNNVIRCVPHHLCEDVFFTFQIISQSTRFAFCRKVTYYYMENSSSLMANGFNVKLIDMMVEAIHYEEEYLKKTSVTDLNCSVIAIIVNYLALLGKVARSTRISAVEQIKYIDLLRNKLILFLNDNKCSYSFLFYDYMLGRKVLSIEDADKLYKIIRIKRSKNVKSFSWYLLKLLDRFCEKLHISSGVFKMYLRIIQ